MSAIAAVRSSPSLGQNMKALVSYVIILSGLACVRAQFSPIADGGAPKADASACPAHDAKPGCNSTSGPPCDPVCQSGTCPDWCSQKCSIAGDGTVACLSKGARETEMSCTISLPDSPQQHDDCVPGDVCLPIIGAGSAFCFQHCSGSLDCPGLGVRCAERPLTTTGVMAMVCDPTYSLCDPAAPGGGCCDPTTSATTNPTTSNPCPPGRFCYLVSKDPVTQNSRTVCEYTTDTNTKSECSLASDCAVGYSCHPTQGVCRQVCDSSHPCPINATCTPNGNQYGFCIPN